MMFFERHYWETVASRFIKENIPIKPTRGNIISADGKLMASSLPEYRIYLDCTANKDDDDPEFDTRKLLLKNLFKISEGLHQIFPDKSARDFRLHLEKGIWKNSKSWLIYPTRISFMQLQEVKQLPVFNLPSRIGGLYQIIYNRRQKPFGSLASRTLGSLYPDASKGAKNGIELSFDSILRGKDGKAHWQKVMNRFMNIVDIPPEDGCDVITTIDVDMQDICEKALVDELKKVNASSGVVVLMEVKTGNVKAIVNMFPKNAVGSVVGLGGMAGSVGGMLFATSTGIILQMTGSYLALFIVSGTAYLISLLIFQLLVPNIKPVKIKSQVTAE